jgi:hypothetical protein
MRTKQRKLKPWLLFLSLLSSLALSSCNIPIKVQDGTACAAAGLVLNGGLCSHLISSDTFTLSYTEILDLLEAHPSARTCIPKGSLPVCADDQTVGGPPVILPPRGASIIMSPSDWGAEKEELDEACRDLGKSCNQVEQLKINGMARMLEPSSRVER